MPALWSSLGPSTCCRVLSQGKAFDRLTARKENGAPRRPDVSVSEAAVVLTDIWPLPVPVIRMRVFVFTVAAAYAIALLLTPLRDAPVVVATPPVFRSSSLVVTAPLLGATVVVPVVMAMEPAPAMMFLGLGTLSVAGGRARRPRL